MHNLPGRGSQNGVTHQTKCFASAIFVYPTACSKRVITGPATYGSCAAMGENCCPQEKFATTPGESCQGVGPTIFGRGYFSRRAS